MESARRFGALKLSASISISIATLRVVSDNALTIDSEINSMLSSVVEVALIAWN